jgi:hypothetical protein
MPGKTQIVMLYSIIVLMFLLGLYELKTGDVQNVPFTTKGGSVYHMTIPGRLLISISIFLFLVLSYFLKRTRDKNDDLT